MENFLSKVKSVLLYRYNIYCELPINVSQTLDIRGKVIFDHEIGA